MPKEIVVGHNRSSWSYFYLLCCKYLPTCTSETLSLNKILLRLFISQYFK